MPVAQRSRRRVSAVIGEFHARSGFYFKRLPDGSVRVRVTMEPAHGSPTFQAIELPENEWASVVASVSRRGEDATTWQAARNFHAASQEPRHTADPRRETWLQAAGDAIYGVLAVTPRDLAEIAVDAYETAQAADQAKAER